MAKTQIVGSLYFDGLPVEVGSRYAGQKLTIGDTVPGYGIPFVEVNGVFIGARCVCNYISWVDLKEHGITEGLRCSIDGKQYLCRLLTVGAEPDVPNEWDAALDATSEDDGLWHWEEMCFWGQEAPTEFSTYRVVCGWVSPRHWNYDDASDRSVHVGFRPVLVPLVPDNAELDDCYGFDEELTAAMDLAASEVTTDQEKCDAECKAYFKYCGEGRKGKYNPYDPFEAMLLRLFITLCNKDTGEEIAVASTRTLFPVSTNEETQSKALAYVMERVYSLLPEELTTESDFSAVRRLCESLSNMGLSTMDPLGEEKLRFGPKDVRKAMEMLGLSGYIGRRRAGRILMELDTGAEDVEDIVERYHIREENKNG